LRESCVEVAILRFVRNDELLGDVQRFVKTVLSTSPGAFQIWHC